MRRVAVGHERHFDRRERAIHVGRQPEMTVMNGIERTAENRKRNQNREPGS